MSVRGLAVAAKLDYFRDMSAIEVINEVRELPLEEQEQVLSFLQDKLRPHKLAEGEVTYADDSDFQKAADKVFRKNDNLFRRLAQ